MDDNKITIVFDDEEVLADVIFTHYSETTGKEYVVYQIAGSEDFSAAVYVQTDETNGYFEDIETDEEWEELEDVLEEYFASLDEEDEDEESDD